jgi:hypothetical protein
MSKIFGVIIFFCACLTGTAATLQQLSLDQMSQSATAIVRARVTGSSTSLTGSTIYTHYKLQTSETWKGFPAVEVMVPGGVAGGYRQTFPGVPALQPGAEYVLFLWTSSTGITHLVGLSQGIYNISKQTDGSIQLSRPEIGETMLDASGRKVTDHAVQMKFADMKTRVTLAATVAATAVGAAR